MGGHGQHGSSASTSASTVGVLFAREVLGFQHGGAASKNTLPVYLPRRDQPVHLLPNKAQQWGLLPMKGAAYAQYPNIFNSSCGFFGSIHRDLKLGRPMSIMRVSKVALDLAKVLRNLGIIASFEVGQKVPKLSHHDYLWDHTVEPEAVSELALYKYKFIKLNLRWDLFKPVWESSSASLSQTPLSVPEHLPLSTKNVSRASLPVFMEPDELRREHERHGAGVFICYNHELGITTDAAVELHQVPALVLAHLGLPMSHAAQIRAAARAKAASEAGTPLQVAPQLKDWSMAEYVHRQLEERSAAVGSGPAVVEQRSEIRRLVESSMREDAAALRDFDVSPTLRKELLAWQLRDKLSSLPSTSVSGGGGGGGFPSSARSVGPSHHPRGVDGAGAGRFSAADRDGDGRDGGSRDGSSGRAGPSSGGGGGGYRGGGSSAPPRRQEREDERGQGQGLRDRRGGIPPQR